jgi:hypothetical protein
MILTLSDCEGRIQPIGPVGCASIVKDIRVFVESTPIPNLEILCYDSACAAEDDEIISTFASVRRFLVSGFHVLTFISSLSVLKIMSS